MKLQALVDTFSQPKTAAEKTVEKTASSVTTLDAAIGEVLDALSSTKTASAESPVAALTKLASEVATVDREGEIKHAQIMGSAFADGFVARLDQYQTAAEKVASAQPSRAELEKQAEATYAETYNDTVREIHKVAAEHFLEGYEATRRAAQQG